MTASKIIPVPALTECKEAMDAAIFSPKLFAAKLFSAIVECSCSVCIQKDKFDCDEYNYSCKAKATLKKHQEKIMMLIGIMNVTYVETSFLSNHSLDLYLPKSLGY